jgi:hypothetical protein
MFLWSFLLFSYGLCIFKRFGWIATILMHRIAVGIFFLVPNLICAMLTCNSANFWSGNNVGAFRTWQCRFVMFFCYLQYMQFTYLVTELSPSWEADSCAATQELPSILWNPKVHYRVRNSPPLVSVLSQIDPVRQICRVAANILNKQSRTADKVRSSSWDVGRRANNSSQKKKTSLLRNMVFMLP